MTVTILKTGLNRLMALTFALLLTSGMVMVNLYGFESETITTVTISDAVAATTIGAEIGGCGVALGLAIGVAALAAGSVTVGFGAAFVISAGFHAGLLVCAS